MSTKEREATGTLRRVFALLRPYGVALVASVLLAVGFVVFTLLVPVLSGRAVDCIVGPHAVDFAGLFTVLRELACTIAATALCQWALSALTNRVAYNVVRDLRVAAFAKLQRLPLSYVDSHRHGDLVNRIVTDADQFSDGLVMTFQQLLTGILTIGLTLWFMFTLNAYVTLVVVGVTPLSILAAKIIAQRGYAYFHDQSERRGTLADIVEEFIGGRPVVEAFDAQGLAQARFESADAHLAKASFSAVFYSSLVNPTTRFVNSLVYAGVGIFGALAALAGTLSVGGLTAFLSYANQYTKPFNDISEVVTELQNSLACAARLFELLEEDEELPDAPGALTLSHVHGEVELDDVSFSYEPMRPLIQDLSLEAKPGMRIAIVGPTGCGKTTLVNLLMRFYDVDSGSIAIDGHDVRDVTRASLRAAYGMVLQETWLRSTTVRENLALGRPNATLEEVHAAATSAFADEFITKLPHGYETVLDGEEAALSAGQRQLLCIARVMLAGAPMLILDEATSSIDTRTEAKVQAAFERLMTGRTSFVVAHRLSTIQAADLIVAMRDGRIVERGTHSELLAKNGFYASLYHSQFEQ